MVLRVGFEEFAATVKKLLGVEDVFLTAQGKGTLATAAAPDKNLIVATHTAQSVEEATNTIKEAGLGVAEGEWSLTGEGFEINQGICHIYVGAVAYHSKDSKPGLWVDAFSEPLSHTLVLRTMYDELRENGELGEVSFEEFIRLANPHVVVVAPSDLTRFAAKHEPCP